MIVIQPRSAASSKLCATMFIQSPRWHSGHWLTTFIKRVPCLLARMSTCPARLVY
jgi:hypothetical protein